MSERESTPRRTTGLRWIVDETFHRNLCALLMTTTTKRLAERLSRHMGQKVEESSIRQLKRPAPAGQKKSSVLVGPLCKLEGWPVPPLADAEEKFGVDAAALCELEDADPAFVEELRQLMHDRIKSMRKARALRLKGQTES